MLKLKEYILHRKTESLELPAVPFAAESRNGNVYVYTYENTEAGSKATATYTFYQVSPGDEVSEDFLKVATFLGTVQMGGGAFGNLFESMACVYYICKQATESSVNDRAACEELLRMFGLLNTNKYVEKTIDDMDSVSPYKEEPEPAC